MKPEKCTHVRVVGNLDFEPEFDLDEFIGGIEEKYKVDIRNISAWKELIKKLIIPRSEFKTKIQNARVREVEIIDKIYLQEVRKSPFQLTSELVRTRKKWQVELTKPNKNEPINIEEQEISTEKLDNVGEEISEESSGGKDNPHLNTEASVQVLTNTESNLFSSHLPLHISTNIHKFISPIHSEDNPLISRPPSIQKEPYFWAKENEWVTKIQTKSVRCLSDIITIYKSTLDEQVIKFSLLNCGKEYLYCRFKCVTDPTHFKRAKIVPAKPVRLYPGVAVSYAFTFKLMMQNEQDFETELYFRIGKHIPPKTPIEEALCINVRSKFTIYRSISMPDFVSIPPVYPWQLKKDNRNSYALVTVSIEDDCSYQLIITKENRALARDIGSDSQNSIKVISPDTESLKEKLQDSGIEAGENQDKIEWNLDDEMEVESIKTLDVINLFLEDCLEKSLETFMFGKTHVNLNPRSKCKIPVYFTKAEHIGLHQSYYDFEFCDPENGITVISKTLRVFSEVLSHPVAIEPKILDLTEVPINNGFCIGYFIMKNNHKLYPVEVKIKLTTKMKKLFTVEPVQVSIPSCSSVKFQVRLCTVHKDYINPKIEEFVHFTIKIILKGIKIVYENVPPLYYEIIAPCAVEYCKVYKFSPDTACV